MNEFMIDCETLGKKYDSAILSIGAVQFSRDGRVGDTFYQTIALDSAIKKCSVDPDTIRWWASQNPKARGEVLSEKQVGKQSLATVLYNLGQWAHRVCKEPQPTFWFKGPQQDAVWIEHAIDVASVAVPVPWRYDKPRDVRTIVDLAEDITTWTTDSVPSVGTFHNALDDAMYQTHLVQAAYKALGGKVYKGKIVMTKKPKPMDDDEL